LKQTETTVTSAITVRVLYISYGEKCGLYSMLSSKSPLQQSFCIFVYGLFNDAVHSLDHTVAVGRMIRNDLERWILYEVDST
jgi:hypothetical protein